MASPPNSTLGALTALGVDPSQAPANGWMSAICPACPPGSRSSFKVNVETGAYRCHRCNASSAQGVALHEFVANPRAPSISGGLPDELPVLDDRMIERYHGLLMDSPAVLSNLERVRGWTTDTVKKLSIGWDGSHLWIPIRDRTGALVNARMYDPFKRARVKSFHYANPDGLKRTVVWLPFGEGPLVSTESVWWMEGEPDGILSGQMGFPVAVVTGGAGTWTEEVLEVSEGRKNVVCYDMDAAGRKGARLMKSRMSAHDRRVVVVEFQVGAGLNDFTDAVREESRTSTYFKKLAQTEWERIEAGTATSEITPIRVKLGLGAPGEPVKVKAHVFGSHVVPALVPATVEARCQANWGDRCATCPVQRANLNLRVEVPSDGTAILAMLAATARAQDAEIRRMGRIPSRCPMVQMTTASMWQVQQMKLIPPSSERQGGDSTVRSAVFVTPADGRPMPVQPNKAYDFIGVIVPDVITSEWTLVSSDAAPAEDDVDSFRLDPALVEVLVGAFQPPSWTVESIREHVLAETRAMSRHVTKIYGREDLLTAVDLVHHSVVQFSFGDRCLTRGWLSLGLVGDTRTGKSETMHRYAEWVGMGRYVMDPSNTTYSGLVGGLQQVGTGDRSWMVTWGLIPINDRGLVVVDEVSSLPLADIGKMSGMRSSGVAEITKIRSASTPARTRLIMAGNPRGVGATLSSYSTPVEAFMELIGAPEDVARFDFALAVVAGLDKGVADRKLGEQPAPIPPELRRTLIKFAWSRTVDQVRWSPGAEDLATSLAKKMIARYSSLVPLVEPSEQDARIARVAVALAVRTFSVDADDPSIVVVRPAHVEYAAEFMDALYDGDLAYRAYSEMMGRQVLASDAAKTVLEEASADVQSVCRVLLSLRCVNPNAIGMSLALDANEARMFVARLVQAGAARFDPTDRRGQSLVWTSEFVQLMRRMEVSEQPAVDLSNEEY